MVAKKKYSYECSAHAKRKRCSSEGCTKFAQKRGVCIRHGAKVKRCSSEGCTSHVVKGGVCVRHGAKVKRCNIEGCTNVSVKGGVCRRHGAYRNAQDASTAFGSEFEMTAATQTYPIAATAAMREGQERSEFLKRWPSSFKKW
eukprot:scaffold3203_cov95-Skeletonema_dohrnii-CCMP3373.AAC.3